MPPPAVMREFTVVMAARTAIEKLTATRAALARKAIASSPSFDIPAGALTD